MSINILNPGTNVIPKNIDYLYRPTYVTIKYQLQSSRVCCNDLLKYGSVNYTLHYFMLPFALWCQIDENYRKIGLTSDLHVLIYPTYLLEY